MPCEIRDQYCDLLKLCTLLLEFIIKYTVDNKLYNICINVLFSCQGHSYCALLKQNVKCHLPCRLLTLSILSPVIFLDSVTCHTTITTHCHLSPTIVPILKKAAVTFDSQTLCM